MDPTTPPPFSVPQWLKPYLPLLTSAYLLVLLILRWRNLISSETLAWASGSAVLAPGVDRLGPWLRALQDALTVEVPVRQASETQDPGPRLPPKGPGVAGLILCGLLPFAAGLVTVAALTSCFREAKQTTTADQQTDQAVASFDAWDAQHQQQIVQHAPKGQAHALLVAYRTRRSAQVQPAIDAWTACAPVAPDGGLPGESALACEAGAAQRLAQALATFEQQEQLTTTTTPNGGTAP